VIALTRIIVMLFAVTFVWFLIYLIYTKQIHDENKKLKQELESLKEDANGPE